MIFYLLCEKGSRDNQPQTFQRMVAVLSFTDAITPVGGRARVFARLILTHKREYKSSLPNSPPDTPSDLLFALDAMFQKRGQQRLIGILAACWFAIVCVWNRRELSAIIEEHKAQLDDEHMRRWNVSYILTKLFVTTNLELAILLPWEDIRDPDGFPSSGAKKRAVRAAMFEEGPQFVLQMVFTILRGTAVLGGRTRKPQSEHLDLV